MNNCTIPQCWPRHSLLQHVPGRNQPHERNDQSEGTMKQLSNDENHCSLRMIIVLLSWLFACDTSTRWSACTMLPLLCALEICKDRFVYASSSTDCDLVGVCIGDTPSCCRNERHLQLKITSCRFIPSTMLLPGSTHGMCVKWSVKCLSIYRWYNTSVFMKCQFYINPMNIWFVCGYHKKMYLVWISIQVG